jgi:hypothetical protein
MLLFADNILCTIKHQVLLFRFLILKTPSTIEALRFVTGPNREQAKELLSLSIPPLDGDRTSSLSPLPFQWLQKKNQKSQSSNTSKQLHFPCFSHPPTIVNKVQFNNNVFKFPNSIRSNPCPPPTTADLISHTQWIPSYQKLCLPLRRQHSQLVCHSHSCRSKFSVKINFMYEKVCLSVL